MSKRNVVNILALVAVIIVVAGAAWWKQGRQAERPVSFAPAAPVATDGDTDAAASAIPAPGSTGLPMMVDLGAKTCIPCKRMAPILAELKVEYAGRAEIIFIDVREDPAAGREFGIRLMPTQIFYDKDGNEVWRHEGFLGKEEIVRRLTELEN